MNFKNFSISTAFFVATFVVVSCGPLVVHVVHADGDLYYENTSSGDLYYSGPDTSADLYYGSSSGGDLYYDNPSFGGDLFYSGYGTDLTSGGDLYYRDTSTYSPLDSYSGGTSYYPTYNSGYCGCYQGGSASYGGDYYGLGSYGGGYYGGSTYYPASYYPSAPVTFYSPGYTYNTYQPSTPVYTPPTISSLVNTNTNTNTNTNVNINNNTAIAIAGQPAPVVSYQNAVYQTPAQIYTSTVSQVAAPTPVVYAAPSGGPFVALSQIPYTGINSDILFTALWVSILFAIVGVIVYFLFFYNEGLIGKIILGTY